MKLFTSEQGIIVKCRIFSVVKLTFIADLPAKKFLKCTSQHNSYNSCDYCVITGQYCNGRMTFPGSSYSNRTDADFRSQSDNLHHKGVTPLQELLGFGGF